MTRRKHRPGVPVYALLAIVVLGAFAVAASARTIQRIAVGVSPTVGGPHTSFVGTLVIPRLPAGHTGEDALTSVKVNVLHQPCITGNYIPFATPAGQTAHITFSPGVGRHWCPGTYHVQVISYDTARSTHRVIGTSGIVHVS